MRDDYTDERRASAQATEALEAEMSKRLFLEKELKEQQVGCALLLLPCARRPFLCHAVHAVKEPKNISS